MIVQENTHTHTQDNIFSLMQDFTGNQPREKIGLRKSKRLTRNGCKQLQGGRQEDKLSGEVGTISETARHLHQEIGWSAEPEWRDRLLAPRRTEMPPRKDRLRLNRGEKKQV